MSALQMIPMDRIEVLNPRERNNRIFEVIVGNIKTLGLKKPVTVTPPSVSSVSKGLPPTPRRNTGSWRKLLQSLPSSYPEAIW